jgi:hypothetical protein
MGRADMAVTIEEGLGALERIIAWAEERRVEQMIHIAVQLADEWDPIDTQVELAQTERTLRIMRAQRALLIRSRAEATAPDLVTQ